MQLNFPFNIFFPITYCFTGLIKGGRPAYHKWKTLCMLKALRSFGCEGRCSTQDSHGQCMSGWQFYKKGKGLPLSLVLKSQARCKAQGYCRKWSFLRQFCGNEEEDVLQTCNLLVLWLYTRVTWEPLQEWILIKHPLSVHF